MRLRRLHQYTSDEHLVNFSKLIYINIILFLINISKNEIYNIAAYDFVDQIIFEIFLLLFYYVCFLGIYHFGKLSNFFFRSKMLDNISLSIFNFYFLLNIVFMHFSGLFKVDGSDQFQSIDFIGFQFGKSFPFLFFVIIFHAFAFYVYSFKSKSLSKRHVLFLFFLLFAITILFSIGTISASIIYSNLGQWV